MLTLKLKGVRLPERPKTFIDEPIDPEGTTDMLKAIRAMEKRNIQLLRLEECHNCGGHYA